MRVCNTESYSTSEIELQTDVKTQNTSYSVVKARASPKLNDFIFLVLVIVFNLIHFASKPKHQKLIYFYYIENLNYKHFHMKN